MAEDQHTIQRVVHTAVNPFVLIDMRGHVIWASESIEELLGVTAEAMVGRQMLTFIAPGSHAAAVEMMADAVDEQGEATHAPPTWEGVGPVFEMLKADGSTVRCSLSAATPARTGLDCFVLQLRRANATFALEDVLLSMGTGQPLARVLSGVASVLEGELPNADVTLFHHHLTTKRLVAVADHSRLADGNDLPALAAEVFATATASPETVVEQSVDDLPSPLRELATGAGYRWLVVMSVPPMREDELAPTVTVWSRASFPMHALNHDRVVRCGQLLTVVLSWEAGRNALEWSATHDLLTGLANRAVFLRELAAIHGPGRRSGDRAAVLYLDLDDFKPVNEQHGHRFGDRVLVVVTERLRRAVRPSDLVARLGGDEFGVLCWGLDRSSDAETVAERLVEDLARPIEVDGIEVRIGLSVGITEYREGDEVETVLHRADQALRSAKRDGKSRWNVA